MGRTEEMRDKLVDQVMAIDQVEDVVAFAGYDLLASARRPNAAAGFVMLKDWSEREGPGENAQAVAGKIMGVGRGLQEANVMAFSPAHTGLSLTGGVEGYIQSQGI